jgi:hypothetical protein
MEALPPDYQVRPAYRLSVVVSGDEATVDVSCDDGADLPPLMLQVAKELVQVLAEKRLAWWNPV